MFRFLRTKHYHNVIHWYEASLSRGKPSSQPKQKPHMMVFTLCNCVIFMDMMIKTLFLQPQTISSVSGQTSTPHGQEYYTNRVSSSSSCWWWCWWWWWGWWMINQNKEKCYQSNFHHQHKLSFWLIESKDVEAPFFHDEGWDAEPGDLVRIDRCQLDGSAICPWTRALCGTHFKPTGIYHNHGGKSMKKEGTLRRKKWLNYPITLSILTFKLTGNWPWKSGR